MAAKGTGPLTKVFVVVLTGVVVPVLVDLAKRDILDSGPEHRPAQQEEAPRLGRQPALAAALPLRPAGVTQVIAHGVGPSPDEALRDALRVALRLALAAQIDADTWARRGPALCEGLGCDSRGLILGWKELRASKEWRLRGALYHQEVAVDVDRNALVERLWQSHLCGWGG